MSQRTETAYKPQSSGESAQHDEAPDSGDLPASGADRVVAGGDQVLLGSDQAIYLNLK